MPSTKMGRGQGWWQIKGSASDTLFTCLLMSRAIVLAIEYLEPEVQGRDDRARGGNAGVISLWRLFIAVKLDKVVHVKGHEGLSLGPALQHQSSWGDGEGIAKETEMEQMRGRRILDNLWGKC